MNTLRTYIKEMLEETPTLKPESQIFCDMDGVIANFEGGIIPVLNDMLAGGDPPYSEVTKGHLKRLRQAHRDLGPDWRVKTKNDINIKAIRSLMLATIGAAPGPIFMNLPPLADGTDKLWLFLNSTDYVVNILTAAVRARPGAGSTSKSGKIEWIGAHLSPPPTEIIVVQADIDGSSADKKARYAMRGGVPNLLIDDHTKNVNAWRAAGGIAIHHIPGGSDRTILELEKKGL
jgi:hypothetical protein|tara:strand:+ start:1128 stop:1823 length:696 start_codon:yes stop_codon:yes gene_type:complete